MTIKDLINNFTKFHCGSAADSIEFNLDDYQIFIYKNKESYNVITDGIYDLKIFYVGEMFPRIHKIMLEGSLK